MKPIPSKFEAPSDCVLADVRLSLDQHIIGRPTSRSSWAFYEELDAWLGPWGSQGYPIAYGRRYAEAFTTHPELVTNGITKQWVFRTARILQEELLEFVLRRMARGTLPELTERELRRAAFATHAAAYDRAGLAHVMVRAPQLVPWVALIPAEEFHPSSENFARSIGQAIEAVARVVPKASTIAAHRAWMFPFAYGEALLGVRASEPSCSYWNPIFVSAWKRVSLLAGA